MYFSINEVILFSRTTTQIPESLRIPIWKSQFCNWASQKLEFGMPKICVYKQVIAMYMVEFIVSSTYKVSVHLWYSFYWQFKYHFLEWQQIPGKSVGF